MSNFDLWSIESRLYASIDAEGMRNKSVYKKTFDLGNDCVVDIKINDFSRTPLSNHSVVNNQIVISLNFRKDKEPWFRVDNESKDRGKPENYLHFHCDLSGKEFVEHQEINGEHTVAQIIVETFTNTYKLIAKKFPNEKIIDGPGFGGFA